MISHSFSSWNVIEPISGDASARRYYRAEKEGKTGILMDCTAEPHNQIPEFVKIGSWLNEVGLRAPKIYESETDNGLLLIEDFGDMSFRKAIDTSGEKLLYYVLATDVLKHLKETRPTISLPRYADSDVHKGRTRVIDWYLPSVKKKKNDDSVRERYLAVWDQIEKSLPQCPQGFVHGDFHLENLLVLPDGEGLDHCGIIDYQDAMMGPLPYDLANLLEDVRVDVPEEIRNAMIAYYTADMLPEQAETFEAWYKVLRTQFHCRIAGWCIRMALKLDKPRYMEFLPRVEGYLRNGLKDPLLQPLKAFFDEIGLDFKAANGLNAGLSMEYIRTDAF